MYISRKDHLKIEIRLVSHPHGSYVVSVPHAYLPCIILLFGRKVIFTDNNIKLGLRKHLNSLSVIRKLNDGN